MTEARKNATYEDLCAVPEHMTAEIVDGELVVMTRPRPKHGNSQWRIGGSLRHFEDDGDPGWWIVVEPLIELSPTRMLSPDLAGWRRSRMPQLPDDPRVEIVPDWVCEILSPTTMRHDRVTKANIYVEHGVQWMWLVDVDHRLVEAYEQSDGAWRRINAWDAEAQEARIPPFHAIPLDVASLFPPPG